MAPKATEIADPCVRKACDIDEIEILVELVLVLRQDARKGPPFYAKTELDLLGKAFHCRDRSIVRLIGFALWVAFGQVHQTSLRFQDQRSDSALNALRESVVAIPQMGVCSYGVDPFKILSLRAKL